MRKVFLVLIIAVLSLPSFSQITKGNWLAGGALSFQSEKFSEDDDRTTRFNFSPNAGYFFADKIAGGMRLSFSHVSNDNDSYRDFIAGPFARYYFLPVAQRANIFLEGHFMAGTEKYENFDAENKTQFGFNAGAAFFFNTHVAVETSLGWRSLKYKSDAGRYSTFGIGIGFQVHLPFKRKKI
jgi:hypothetical protein